MDSNSEFVGHRLIEILKNNVPELKLASGGKELTMRCRFCGDSIKDPRARHMYISLPTNDTPALFKCFKCNARGIVTAKMLSSIGIIDPELSVGLELFNNKILSYTKNFQYRDFNVYYLKNDRIANCQKSKNKLDYINNRVGLNLTYKDLIDNKIVLNLSDLFFANPKLTATRGETILRELDEYFLGFISADNCFMNMRNLAEGKVSEPINKRYINYRIYNKYDNTQKYYVAPTTINLALPGRVKVHVAEGPFDILSIKYNCRNNETGIYSAIGGNTYLNIIQTFLNVHNIINMEAHIYLDNDVDGNRISNSIADYLVPYNIPLFIHLNEFPNEKDFGVPKCRIKENVIQLI